MRHVLRQQLRSFASSTCQQQQYQQQRPCRQWQQPWAATLSSPTAVLEHQHLVEDNSTGLTKYETAEELQEQHRSRFLAWKGSSEQSSTTTNGCPKPVLLSFESTPTFTLGRRQDDVNPDQKSRLERDLDVNVLLRPDEPIIAQRFRPLVKKTNRGGLTTYHGPGQLVLWPIIDMHSPLYAKYSVSSYASHLEATTQRLLAELFSIQTYTSRDEPGVWVETPAGQPRKIAALGVHHRRHVTALGTAINIHVPVAGGEHVNPWARFVPCGLEGKLVTSVAAEVGSAGTTATTFDMPALACRWASIFEEGLMDASKRGVDLGR